MKAFVSVSRKSGYIAKDLLYPIKNINTIFSLRDDEIRDFSFSLKNNLNHVDIIFVFIDDSFEKSTSSQIELKTALELERRRKRNYILPIILNGATIPEDLKYRNCLFLNSESSEDFALFREKIKKTINQYELENTIKEDKSYRKFQKYSSLVSLIFIPVSMILITFTIVISLIIGNVTDYDTYIMVTIFAVSITITTTCLSFMYFLRKRLLEDKTEERAFYSKKIDSALVYEKSKEFPNLAEKSDKKEKSAEKKEFDILGLVKLNLENINDYYSWSQKQTKASFILAVVMSILGFVLVIVGIILPIVLELNIEIAFIPAIGGVITELIAGTALVVYRSSLSQLNHYHNALHEDERFLSSVNLLNQFSTVEYQDEMLKEIIKSEIQMNVIEAENRKNLEKSRRNN